MIELTAMIRTTQIIDSIIKAKNQTKDQGITKSVCTAS